MNNWVQDIHDMHTKFGVREAVAKLDDEKLKKFLEFRLKFLQEELDEAWKAHNEGGEANAEHVVDALIYLCVVAIGTLDAFQADAYEAWNRVHEKNMQKEVGIKPNRPNPLGLPDLIKPAGWTSPTHVDNVGLLPRIMNDRPLSFLEWKAKFAQVQIEPSIYQEIFAQHGLTADEVNVDIDRALRKEYDDYLRLNGVTEVERKI